MEEKNSNESREENNESTEKENDRMNENRSNGEETENIIPWRAQLRKTNSRLSLVG